MNMKSRNFANPQELTVFVNNGANGVTSTKFLIVHNTGSNTFTLFWW